MPSANPPAARRVAGTAAFSKFMAILQLIADADEPLGVGELSAASGYPRPTVYRIVAALVAQGLVNEHSHDGTFDLGARLVNLASRSWERSDVRVAAVEALTTLRDTVRETVHLAVPTDRGMVYIEKLESPHVVRMASRIGTRVTLYSSSVGKAYLAALARPAREALLETIEFERFTANTIASQEALRRELALTAQRGYAEDSEENEAEIFCYGCAILGSGGAPLGGVSISVPLFRRHARPLETYVEPLIAACREIGRRLGHLRGK
jgi:DNA-binding IclR family transcriptional regulator